MSVLRQCNEEGVWLARDRKSPRPLPRPLQFLPRFRHYVGPEIDRSRVLPQATRNDGVVQYNVVTTQIWGTCQKDLRCIPQYYFFSAHNMFLSERTIHCCQRTRGYFQIDLTMAQKRTEELQCPQPCCWQPSSVVRPKLFCACFDFLLVSSAALSFFSEK